MECVHFTCMAVTFILCVCVCVSSSVRVCTYYACEHRYLPSGRQSGCKGVCLIACPSALAARSAPAQRGHHALIDPDRPRDRLHVHFPGPVCVWAGVHDPPIVGVWALLLPQRQLDEHNAVRARACMEYRVCWFTCAHSCCFCPCVRYRCERFW